MNIPREIRTRLTSLAFWLLPAVVAAAATALAFTTCAESSAPAYTRVQVDSVQVVEDEPDTTRTLGQRILSPSTEPELVATAPGAARNDVSAFCSAAGWAPPGHPSPAPPATTSEDSTAIPPGDSTAPATPASAVPSAAAAPVFSRARPLAFARSGRFDDGTLELWTIDSNAALTHVRYTCPENCSFRMDGDSAIVRYPWLWWWDDAALIGAGGGLCYAGIRSGSAGIALASCTAGGILAGLGLEDLL